jgi:hypothetical protein
MQILFEGLIQRQERSVCDFSHRIPMESLCQLLESVGFLFAMLGLVGDLQIKRCSQVIAGNAFPYIVETANK